MAVHADPELPIDSVGPSLTAAAAADPVQSEGITCTVFAAAANTHSGNSEDFFITDDGTRIGHGEISPAVVSTTPIAGKPTASATAPAQTCNGPVNVTLFATDPSPADTAAGFTFLVDRGGSPVLTVPATANNGSGVPASHDYMNVGVFTVTLRAVDQHGEVSDEYSTLVSVGGAELRPDPSDPGTQALYGCGSSGNDLVRFAESGTGHTVTINGQAFGPFDNFERIILQAGDGADDVRILNQWGHPAVFFGGAGNDTLVARNDAAILVGGEGNDALTGGSFKDLLIGGGGADNLRGGGNQDILVAGRTAFDAGSDDDVRALSDIQREWTSSHGYPARIANITGAAPGGHNGVSFLKPSGPGQTVFDDGVVDTLLGGGGRDWLLFRGGAGGDATDLALNETGTAI